MRVKSLFLSILCFLSVSSFAQQTSSFSSTPEEKEKELLLIINELSASVDYSIKSEINKRLINKFMIVLNSPEAMAYPFEKLTAISNLKNKAGDFRVFTWELEDSLSRVSYFGVLAYISDNKVFTDELSDSSRLLSNPQYLRLSPERWYGALYYDIREYNYKDQRQLVLLGINRNQTLIKKKVIEIVDVSNDLRFGMEVFEIPKEFGIKRKIYEYAVEAEMSIWFDGEEDRILMDHLSPLNSMHEGKYEYYIPDLSFDALNFKKGIWRYEADCDARMNKDPKDPYFEMELPEQKKVY